MAGDWIKMRSSLGTHPKVLQLAKIIGSSPEVGRKLSTGFSGRLDEIVSRDVTRDVTLASLMRVWCATNEHTSDGVWPGVDLDDIDQIAGIPGFAEAMIEVGWLSVDAEAGTLTLPNFLKFNAPSKGAARQQRYRQRLRGASGDDQSGVTGDVTRDVTRDAQSKSKRRTTPVAKATGVPAQRGTRLPDDWQLPKTWGEWALQERPDWTADDVRRVALAFRNHWVAKAGRDATKRDWSATWQNWVLKEPRPRPGAGPRAGKQAELEARNRAAGDAFEQGGAHAAA